MFLENIYVSVNGLEERINRIKNFYNNLVIVDGSKFVVLRN